MATYPVLDWRRAMSSQPKDALSQTDKLVAHTLMIHMSVDGDACWPSLETIAAEASMTKDTVIKAIGNLEEKGWISVRRGGGRGNPNRYAAAFPKVVFEGQVNAWEVMTCVEDTDSETVDLTGETVDLAGVKGRSHPTVGIHEDQKEDHAPPSRRAAPPSRRAPSPRRRNLVWDVLVEHFDAPQGTSASKDFGSSVKEIREILSSNFSQPLDDPASEPYVRQQIGLRVEQMGEARYRTHRVLRRDWTRLGSLAGLDGSGGIVRSASAPAVSWEDADVNPLGQLTECEICGEDEGNHHEQCPNA